MFISYRFAARWKNRRSFDCVWRINARQNSAQDDTFIERKSMVEVGTVLS
jgi:hypothetical protein